MERKIGEIFEYNGEWYQCIEGRCRDCYFSEENFLCKEFKTKGFCTSVIFKKLEKVMDLYKYGGKYVRYKVSSPCFMPKGVSAFFNATTDTMDIEIKQNKEDMKENNDGNTSLNELTDRYVNGSINYDEFEKEVKALYSCKKEDLKEKKIQHYDCFFDKKSSKSNLKPKEDMEEYRMYNAKEDIPEFGKVVDEYLFGEDKLNLKPFDLEAAKQGKPVYTRDGRKARIICFDRKSETPIIALVTELDGIESIYSYHNNGMWYSPENTNGCDLMMLPEKKEGWVNVYKRKDEYICENECNVSTGIVVYESESEAKRNIDKNGIYVDTVKITWGE